MDYLDFCASVVKSIVWPTVVANAVFLFRQPISQRIASIQNFKIGKDGVAADWNSKVKEVEMAVANPARIRQFALVNGCNTNSHIDRVANAWLETEEELRKKFLSVGIEEKSLSGEALVDGAKKHGLITDHQSRSLLGLLTLYDLARARPDELNETRIMEFLTLAKAVRTVLVISD